VFVSGASSGIGRALAGTVPFPARVIGISRRPLSGCEHLRADLADPGGWEAVAKRFEHELSRFSGERVVFIHAAGTLTPIGFAGEVDAQAYRRQVLINAASPAVLGEAFLRASCSTQAACDVVMISSGAAQHLYPGWSAYAAGKAAVDQWVRTAGAEQALRGSRCRVVSIAPGVVATPMQEEIRRSSRHDFPSLERFVALHERGELRDPLETARELWDLLGGDLENGTVLDLRDAATRTR
jgi:benzil reductase ((S)-benzoin forming)